MTTQALEYIEIDVPWCALTYGVAPCQAELGVTGSAKCFNTRPTCQDLDNIDLQTVTLRFARPTDYLPDDIDAIPSIHDVDFTPQRVSLGEDLGTRATLEVIFDDHPWSDTGEGFDKYHAERPYNPYDQGTFWGKFRARFVSLRGQPIRWIQGLVGQSLEEMTTRHYVIDSIDGPHPDGTFSIIAKDPMKLLDGDRAQAPVLSSGFLLTAIDEVETSATLSPVGIGDLEYPTEGYIVIGGNEVCAFTRVADSLTLTRGQKGTTAATHNDGERMQLGIEYEPQSPALIIHDLLTTYVPGFDPDWIDLDNWESETTSFLGTPYSGFIAEPTAVRTLINELIEQAALIIWWDDIAQQVRLRVLRGISTEADQFTEDNTLGGSLRVQDQPEKRVSQVWIYFIQLDPTKPLNELDNYGATQRNKDEESEITFGSPAIKKIFSRWIPAGGRPIANRLGELILSRYTRPPRHFEFAVQRYYGIDSVDLGRGYQLGSRVLQDVTGAKELVPIQTTRVNPLQDRFEAEADEMLWKVPPDVEPGTIVVDFDTLNINLRELHDNIWGPPVDNGGGYVVNLTIEEGVTVGGSRDFPPDNTFSGRRIPTLGTGLPAIDVGDWGDVISFVTIRITNRGRIQGLGGDGGEGQNDSISRGHGLPGGEALRTSFPINLDNIFGQIWSGAGGGAGVVRSGGGATQGGGGGAGTEPGAGGESESDDEGAPGTAIAGGETAAPIAGEGGGPGRRGEDVGSAVGVNDTRGGREGYALNGEGQITFLTDGVTEDNDEAVDGSRTRQSSASVDIAAETDIKVSAAIEYDGLERVYGENLQRSALIAALFDDATVTFESSDVSTSNQASYTFAAQGIGATDAQRKVDVCVVAFANADETVTAVEVAGNAVADLTAQITQDNSDGGYLIVGIFSVAVAAGTSAQIDVTFSGTVTSCAIDNYRRVGAGAVAPVTTRPALGINPLVNRFTDVPAGSAVIAVAGAMTASGNDITGVEWEQGSILGQRAA